MADHGTVRSKDGWIKWRMMRVSERMWGGPGLGNRQDRARPGHTVCDVIY